MDCEICGRNDSLKLVSVKGTRMMVCSKCQKYGAEVAEKEEIPYKPVILKATGEKKDVKDPDAFDFVDNYNILIQRARSQKNLTRKELAFRIQEPESYIIKVESGKIKPTEKVTKKLEKFLDIKIHEE